MAHATAPLPPGPRLAGGFNDNNDNYDDYDNYKNDNNDCNDDNNNSNVMKAAPNTYESNILARATRT